MYRERYSRHCLVPSDSDCLTCRCTHRLAEQACRDNRCVPRSRVYFQCPHCRRSVHVLSLTRGGGVRNISLAKAVEGWQRSDERLSRLAFKVRRD